MKRIFTTLAQKWPEYLLEIIVITVGILGAFALNNWSSRISDNNKEAYILNRLHKELKADSAKLENYINLNQGHAQRADYLIEHLNSSTFELDSVVSNVFYVGRFVWFKSISPTYDEIVSSGQLRLIKNDLLKNELSNFYGSQDDYVSFMFHESQNQKANYNLHKNQYFDHSIMTEFWKSGRNGLSVDSLNGYQMDWEGFRKDPETIIHLRTVRGVNKELAWMYANRLRQRLNKLLQHMRKEIELKR